MTPELGVFALILAFCLSLSQSFFGLVGAWRDKPAWMSVARPAVTGPGDENHIEIVRLDDPIQVHINKILTRRSTPMTHHQRLYVLQLQRLFQEGIVV